MLIKINKKHKTYFFTQQKENKIRASMRSSYFNLKPFHSCLFNLHKVIQKQNIENSNFQNASNLQCDCVSQYFSWYQTFEAKVPWGHLRSPATICPVWLQSSSIAWQEVAYLLKTIITWKEQCLWAKITCHIGWSLHRANWGKLNFTKWILEINKQVTIN